MNAKSCLKRLAAIVMIGCLLVGMCAVSVFAAETAEKTVVEGVANETTEYIDYIIGEDAGDTVVLDGSAMEYYILNQAWNPKPGSWMPGSTAVGRMNIINESGVPYVITGIEVDTLSPDDMEGMSYPDGYEIYGPDGLLIPTEFVQHRTLSKPLADLYGLESAVNLTLDQLVNAEAKITEKYAGAGIETYADYLLYYFQENAEEIAPSISSKEANQKAFIEAVMAAQDFSELPDEAIFWMNKGNAAVEATEDEVSAVIEGNEKAEIYGHWDKNKNRYYIYEFDPVVAQTVYSIQFKKLMFFSFDNEKYPVILGGNASADNPDMNLYDHIVGQNVAAQSQNELIGQKIADDANLALDNIAYHLSTRMNNNYQVTGLAFMFNITLERVQSNYSIEYYQDVVDEDHLIAVDNDYTANVGDTVAFPQEVINKYLPEEAGYEDGTIQGESTLTIVEDADQNVFRVLYVRSPYQVFYDANGGSGSQTDSDNPYFADETVTVLDEGTMEREGYLFDGWNTEADGSGTAYEADDTFTMPKADVTLYAQWLEIIDVEESEPPLGPGPGSEPESKPESEPGSESAPGTESEESEPTENIEDIETPLTGVGGHVVPLTLLMAAAGAAAIVVGKKSKKED